MSAFKYWKKIPMIIFISVVLQFGCGSTKPSRFYALRSTLDADPGIIRTDPDSHVSVGIDKLKMPDHLLRPQIVTRASGNRMEYAEYDRWAESLDENFSRILAENLSRLLPSENVYIFPWKSSTAIQYYLTPEITQFSHGADGNTALVVFWSIYDHTTGKELLRKKTVLQKPGPAAPVDYGRLVEIMSQLVAEYSREVVAELKTLEGK